MILLLRHSKEGFSAYSSPAMLIGRKVTKYKGVVTDFRHLNVRITKNNLDYPLLKDTFSVSIIGFRFKRCILFPKTFGKFKKILGILPYFGSASYLYQIIHMALQISPLVWQSYINAILDCLQS